MSTPVARALAGPVTAFIEDLTPVLERIASEAKLSKEGTPQTDVALDAYNLAAGFIDVDGRHTDDELWAFAMAFAPYFDTMLQFATPKDVRSARLVIGKKTLLQRASVLFEILVADDKRNLTIHSWRYYERALAIAHTVASLDVHPSTDELQAIDAYRTLLLETMDRAGVARPGSTPPVPGTPATATGASGAPAAPATEPLPPARPLEELLAELDALVGLAAVKAEVKLVADLLQVQRLRKERGMPVVESSHHLVFTGNPGTGKTTVARLLAQIYRTLGVVDKGHLIETDRSGLVAGFVGQTAIQVREVVQRALGGVLLVDEAYALARGDQRDFGQEAIDTLVKLIEDHRDDLVVIAAGYPDEMAQFVDSNPGLRSRFPKTIQFPDYTTDELLQIFISLGKKSAYACPPETVQRLRAFFEAQPRDKGFGNARLARNLFEASIARQASRIVKVEHPTDAQLSELTPDDVAPAPA